VAKPDFVKQAEDKARAEAAKITAPVRSYVETFMTSRITMGLAAAFFIAFSTTALFFPERLPPIASVGLVNAGLIAPPPTIDLSDFDVSAADIKAKQSEAVSTGKPALQEGYDKARAKVPNLTLYLDIAGALAAFALYLYTLKIQIRAARTPTKSVAL
jgi:hypothetical protein